MDETADSYIAPPGQDEIVAALRAGDEAAFAALVDELGPSMLRVAMMFALDVGRSPRTSSRRRGSASSPGSGASRAAPR